MIKHNLYTRFLSLFHRPLGAAWSSVNASRDLSKENLGTVSFHKFNLGKRTQTLELRWAFKRPSWVKLNNDSRIPALGFHEKRPCKDRTYRQQPPGDPKPTLIIIISIIIIMFIIISVIIIIIILYWPTARPLFCLICIIPSDDWCLCEGTFWDHPGSLHNAMLAEYVHNSVVSSRSAWIIRCCATISRTTVIHISVVYSRSVELSVYSTATGTVPSAAPGLKVIISYWRYK